jgi:hypothetical protein
MIYHLIFLKRVITPLSSETYFMTFHLVRWKHFNRLPWIRDTSGYTPYVHLRGDGITLKANLILIILLAIGTISLIPVGRAAEIVVDVHILGESTQLSSGQQVLIAGIWHQINVTIEGLQPDTVTIKLYKGDTVPTGDKNATNYYEWSYNSSYDFPWRDVIRHRGFHYIKNASCVKTGNLYSFCVGISDTLPNVVFYKEPWMLEVYGDNTRIYREEIIIEKQTKGIAKSHGDFISFYIDPFTEMIDAASDHIILKNTGNVPLEITIDYDPYNDLLEFTRFPQKISPYSNGEYYIQLHSESWQPQLMSGTGVCEGKVPDYLIVNDTDATVVLFSSLAIDGPSLKIFVGHSAYELNTLLGSDITFQYKKHINMLEGEIRDISVYLSGDGEVNLDIWADEQNVKIHQILSQQQEVESPFTMRSSSSYEHTIVIRVEAIRENHVGYIHYDIQHDGNTQSFETQITIEPPTSTSQEESSLNITSNMTIIVVICIVFVIGYMVISQVRYRRK